MIVGGRIFEVSAKKNKDSPPQGMNVNINIEDVKTEGGSISVKYSYSNTYLPDVAELLVKGEVFAEEKEKERDRIAREWRDKKVLPPEFAEELLTVITYACSAVGTLLAFSLGITAPINVPRARLTPATPAQPTQPQEKRAS